MVDISALNRRKEQIAYEMIEASRDEFEQLQQELEDIEEQLETLTDYNEEDYE